MNNNVNYIYPYSILVIEDEDILREQLVEILMFEFQHVYDAPNAEIALELYKSKMPNIMLVDINLPNMSGLEFLQKIRENDHTTKAIVLTAHSNTEFLLEATGLKLTDYLVKPFSGKNLDIALEKAIHEIKKFKTTAVDVVKLNDDFCWHSDEKELYNGTHLIELSLLEKKLLQLFFTNQNIMLDYNNIIYQIWDNDDDSTKMNALKTLIKKLRHKLPKDSILNVYKEGFIFKS